MPLIANSGIYPIRNFTPAEYNAGIQNIDFAQNRDLNLYVANNLGVLSFNGVQWKSYAKNTGKKQRSLAFDEGINRLYVGAQGDFGFFEDDWNFTSLLDKIPLNLQDFDEVWDVFIVDSDVYFCTFQRIYRFDGESIFVINHSNGFDRTFQIGRNLFTQDQFGNIFQIDEDKLTPLSKNSKGSRVVAGMVQSESGYMVIYNSGEIELIDLYGAKPALFELAEVLKGQFVNHVAQISDGRLVISTQRAGLFLYDLLSGSIENITSDQGLMSNACLRVFQDNTGNLWVGMQNGIALLDIRSPMRLLSNNFGLEGSGYEAFERSEGTYYTTSNGIFFNPKNQKESNFLIGTEGPAYGLNEINEKLYAGHHTGLFLLENGQAIKIASSDGLWKVKLLRSNPQFAIGGTYSGLQLFQLNERGELQAVQKINGFNESSRFFEEDRKGNIWVGQYYKGLYRVSLSNAFTEAEVEKVSDNHALPIQQYIFLSRVDDEIFICTVSGIFKLDQANDEIVEEKVFSKVVGNNWVYQFVQDKQKNVYVYSENMVGIFKQIGPGNYAFVPSSLFQLRHSFNNDLLSVSLNVGNGVLFNANEGFIHYYPELEDRVSISATPLIGQVNSVADNNNLYYRSPFDVRPLELDPIRIVEGTKVLQFVIESFLAVDANNQQFRYQLEGFDKEFSDWTNSFIKEYTNLKAGTYTFIAETFGSRGEIVTSLPLKIIVDPPFYKTVHARFIYFLAVFALLYLLYRLQRQYYRRKEARQEEVRKLELERKQMELQQVKEEQIKTELRHLNNLLASSTMNLVVKNEFMENIKEEIKQAILANKADDKQQALERIIKEIDSSLKVNEDWKQFEYHFDQVHGDFLTRLTSEFKDLTPGEQKLCAFLRLKMDTKEIANLMGITLRGVEVARYRLRKKLGLDSGQNLSKFILEY